MKAVWYEKFGAAGEVLTYGDMPEPEVRSGEVLVRIKATGINPSDVKLRAGARPGAVMAYPRIIPQSDGAGVIEAVGAGVDPARVGERVWIWNGQWERPFGTASGLIALPGDQAVPLADKASFEVGACMGIPAMTAWYATHGAMDLGGKTVFVTGGAGTVGRYACQMAALGSARVITSVSSAKKAAHAGVADWINYREQNVVEAVMDLTSGAGVDLVVDVDFGANQANTVAILKPSGVVSAYASIADMTPPLQFYPLMFKNITLRMLIAYLIPDEARRRGEAAIGDWLASGALSHAVVDGGALADLAVAHDLVSSGEKLGTVVSHV